MKNLFTIIWAVLSTTYIVTAQAPEVEWENALNDGTRVRSVMQTNDGGFIVGGRIGSPAHYWIDNTGNTEWEKTFNDGSGYHDIYSIQQTTDGGYVFIGHKSGSGLEQVWVYKLDSSGDLVWKKNIRYSEIYKVFPSIEQTPDGGYILSLKEIDIFWYTNNHSWAIKLDSQGNVEWQTALGTTYSIHKIKSTSDNGYIAVGYTITTSDTDDIWIVKLNSQGNVQWEKFYGGSGKERPNSVIQTNDGGYMVVGNTTSNDGDITDNKGGSDIWVLKLQSNGNLEWQRTYGGSSGDGGVEIVKQAGGAETYLIGGGTGSDDGDVSYNHGQSDAWIFKINSTGDILWEKTYGSSGIEGLSSLSLTNDGGSVFVGSTFINSTTSDYWLVKLAPDTMSVTDYLISDFEIYPNPANDIVNFSNTIDAEVFDITGKKILTVINSSYLDVSGLAKGIYILQTAEGVTKKIIVK
jgi:hypothetical protein